MKHILTAIAAPLTPEQRILVACERPQSFLALVRKLRLPESIVETAINVLLTARDIELTDGWRYRVVSTRATWTNHDERVLMAGLTAGDSMRVSTERIGRSTRAGHHHLLVMRRRQIGAAGAEK